MSLVIVDQEDQALRLLAQERAYAVVWAAGNGVICVLEPLTKVWSSRHLVTKEFIEELAEHELVAKMVEKPNGCSYSITLKGRALIGETDGRNIKLHD